MNQRGMLRSRQTLPKSFHPARAAGMAILATSMHTSAVNELSSAAGRNPPRGPAALEVINACSGMSMPAVPAKARAPTCARGSGGATLLLDSRGF